MLIIGAKGFAKEVLEIFHQKDETENLFFYDDISPEIADCLYDQFEVVKSEKQAQTIFETISKEFTLGIGNPKLRNKLSQKFINLNGKFTSSISRFAEIGSFGVEIGDGCNILSGVKISNDVKVGRGTIIYYNAIVTHDVSIGEFCEISPGATLLGRCRVGNFVSIGAGAIIFPDVNIGDHAVIASGAVVRNHIPENAMAAGVPATIKKTI
ncbi:acetyltransferase [Epilithonimonas tenax]|uniref:acetyltransferase n=1 Tax=Epilithonimonas tenax TaxID=191577 RepID=UPI00041B3D69|nr:acetyltransferase [Epilithonimonas tenax]